jgi:hypothetical protein
LASFVESTVKDIEARLRALKQEVEQLEAAHTALSGARRGPGRPRGTRTRRARASSAKATTGTATTKKTTRRRTGARGRRGGATRANQALQLVKGKPGITIPEIAKSMGIEPNYLYRVLPKLAQEGQIKRDGQGWRAAS